jgi:hypothetical protein
VDPLKLNRVDNIPLPGGGGITAIPQSTQESAVKEPADGFITVGKDDAKHKYTVISFLGVVDREREDIGVVSVLGVVDPKKKEIGAPQELKEYLENLAPQIKDNSLALVILGNFPEGDDFRIKRYEIDCRGVRDTTNEAGGLLASNHKDDQNSGVPVYEGDKLFKREVLQKFIVDSMKRYPAEHYVLSMHAHGGNITGISGTQGKGATHDLRETPHQKDSMSLPVLQDALEGARKETGEKFGIIDLDCCQMGHFEVVNALKNETDYIIASPHLEMMSQGSKVRETIHGVDVARNGHQQVEVFEKILKTPNIKPHELAKEFIDVNAVEGKVTVSWYDQYRKDPNEISKSEYDIVPTLSAYSTDKADNLGQWLDVMGADLYTFINDPNDKKKNGLNLVCQIISNSQVFDRENNKPFIDLKSFMNNAFTHVYRLPENDPYRETANAIMQDISLADFRGGFPGWENYPHADMRKFGPIGVFLPGGKTNALTMTIGSLTQQVLEIISLPVDSPKVQKKLSERHDIYTQCFKEEYTIPDIKDTERFWSDAVRNSEEIGLTKDETAKAGKFQSMVRGIIEAGESGSPESDNLKNEYKALLLNGEYKEAGIKKIFDNIFNKKYSHYANYEELKDFPPNWRKFVLSIKDNLTNEYLNDFSKIF